MKKTILFLLFVNLIYFSIESKDLTKENIKTFFDQNVQQMIDQYKIAGAEVVVINDKEIIYNSGFGYSDVINKINVNPDKTLFRSGSISKLFIWTSIMQLYEVGKIDLNTDINKYLKDLKIPETFNKPITINNLMSHSAGFEDLMIGLMPNKPDNKILSKEKPPKRINPPDNEISYSNYGAALAAHIVESVSELPFYQYVEKNIFKPLGMNNSTFLQPLPEDFLPNLSKGYLSNEKEFKEQRFEFIGLGGYPAGSLSTTSTDMAKFLIAIINNGKYNNISILKEDTAKLMKERNFSMDSRMNGFAHGFIEFDTNNERIIGHGGDTQLFHSITIILPNKNFAFYLSTNTNTGEKLVFDLTLKFIKEFVPVKEKIQFTKLSEKELKKYTGNYLINRSSQSNFTRLIMLLQNINVSISKDGCLLIPNLFNMKLEKFYSIDKNIFENENRDVRYVFLENSKGEINSIMMNLMPMFEFKKPLLKDQPLLNYIIILLSMLIFILSIIFRPTGLLAIFSKKNKNISTEIFAGFAGLSFVICYLVFAIIMLINIVSMSFLYGNLSPIIFIIPYTGLFFNITTIYFCFLSWKNKFWKLPGRIFYSLMTISGLSFFWFLINWKFVF